MKKGCRFRQAGCPRAACPGGAFLGPDNISRQTLEVAQVARDEFVGLRLIRYQAKNHERLSRSSATALPMASGSSVYPLGT